MFIRRRLVHRQTYYQVVESVVIGGKTHQRLIVSLGRESDPVEALETMELELLLDELPDRLEPPETPKERAARLKRVARLRDRVNRLTEVLEKKQLPGHRMPRRLAGRIARTG
jgi:hypothetical protein